ncbi:Alpha-farnesene synthase [Linum perenne]
MLKDFVNNKCDEDIKGLVELYEASHLGSEIEDILEEANLFSTRILKSEYLRLCQHDKTLARSVAHALELPIHWRVEWFDVKWHIDTSENKRNVHKALVDLAKVNFNVVQSGLQKDLKQISRNGVVSSSGTVLAIHAFYLVMRDETTGEIERVLEKDHNNMIHNVCLIIRLCNDLGTSSAEQERGDAKSSIACYMREAGVTEETARLHIKGMIARIWKKINSQWLQQHRHQHHPAIPNLFMDININMARVAHNLYQYGDGFNGGQDHKHYKKQILSLLVHPITL